jgi:hypothetical protein
MLTVKERAETLRRVKGDLDRLYENLETINLQDLRTGDWSRLVQCSIALAEIRTYVKAELEA